MKTYFAFVLLISLLPSEAKGDPPRPCPWPGAAAPPAGREGDGAGGAALRERRERPRPAGPHQGTRAAAQLASRQAGKFRGAFRDKVGRMAGRWNRLELLGPSPVELEPGQGAGKAGGR